MPSIPPTRPAVPATPSDAPASNEPKRRSDEPDNASTDDRHHSDALQPRGLVEMLGESSLLDDDADELLMLMARIAEQRLQMRRNTLH